MFDPASEIWTVLRNEPSDPGLQLQLSFVRDNKFYFLGGVGPTFLGHSTEVKYFDMETNDWVHVANLPLGAGNIMGIFYNV